MRKIPAIIFKIIAILLASLTIIATIFTLLFLSFDRILLDSQTYRQAFAENNVYEQVPATTADEFALVKGRLLEPCDEELITGSCLDQTVNAPQAGELAKPGRLGIEGAAFLNGLSAAQWRALVRHVFAPDDLQLSTQTTVDVAIAYFKGETDTINMPLTNTKARLAGMTDAELISLLLNSQPACTLEQQTLIMSTELSKPGSSPIFCSATGGTSQVLLLDLKRRLNAFASEIPDHITFIKPPSPSIPSGFQKFIGKDLQAAFNMLNANAQYIPFLPLGLLVLVAVFGVRSLRGWLRWWSIPIFLASLFTLLLCIVIFFMFDRLWLNYVLTDFSPLLTSGFENIIYDVAHSLATDFARHLMLQTGILALVSLGIILISSRVPPPPDPSLPPLAQPGTPGGPVLNPQKKRKSW